jgi:hypothetical protein
MKASFIKAQRGSSLTEALVSVLLVATMGLGIVYVVSKVLLTQRYTTTQNLAVIHIREHLQRGDNGSQSFVLAGETVELTVDKTIENLNVSIGPASAPEFPVSVTNAVTGVQVTAENENLFGAGGAIVLSHGTAPQMGAP